MFKTKKSYLGLVLLLLGVLLSSCGPSPEELVATAFAETKAAATNTPIPSTKTPKPTETVILAKVLVFVRDGSMRLESSMEKEIGVMLFMLEESGILAVVATQSEDSYLDSDPPLKSDILLKEVNVSDYDGFLLPCMSAGNPDYIHDDAVAMVAEAAAQNKPIAALHGSVPTLAKAGVLAGKNYAYDRPFMEGTLAGSGVVQDGNIITSGKCPFAAAHDGVLDGTPELIQLFIEAVTQ